MDTKDTNNAKSPEQSLPPTGQGFFFYKKNSSLKLNICQPLYDLKPINLPTAHVVLTKKNFCGAIKHAKVSGYSHRKKTVGLTASQTRDKP